MGYYFLSKPVDEEVKHSSDPPPPPFIKGEDSTLSKLMEMGGRSENFC